MPATEYKVFVAGEGDAWSQIGEDVVTAFSADAAIREVASSRTTSGTYVAVPARSWQPRTVEVEQTTKVSFKEQT